MCFMNPGPDPEDKIKNLNKKMGELEEDRSKTIRRLDVIEHLQKGNGKLLALLYEEIKVLKSVLRKSSENKIKFPIIIDVRKFQDELFKACSGAWTKNGLEYISAITLDRVIEVAFECLTKTRDSWSHSDPIEVLIQEIKRLKK